MKNSPSWFEVFRENWSWLDCLWLPRIFRRDAKRTYVLFMGPKEHGKTEFFSALKNEEFKKRHNSGVKVKPKKIPLRYEGKILKLAVVDSGGEDENIAHICKRACEYISESRPNFVIVALVVDLNEAAKNIDAVAEHLEEYIALMAETCEGNTSFFKGQRARDIRKFVKSKYDESRWGYMLIGTHGQKSFENEVVMEKVADRIKTDKFYGRMINLFPNDSLCFELSNENDREEARKCIGMAIQKIME